MNTVLIVMALAGRLWAPSYAVVYDSEKQCQEAASKFEHTAFSTKKAVCVPQVFVR